MNIYSSYNIQLEELAQRILSSSKGLFENRDAVERILDGEPSDRLRELVPIWEQRKSGAFFTPVDLAMNVGALVKDTFTSNSIISDIACGVGDLLIACLTPIGPSPKASQIISDWNRQVRGHDIHQEFVTTTKLRLLFHALKQASLIDLAPIENTHHLFPEIELGNGLSSFSTVSESTHLVINPPFSQMPAPKDCGWASGKVNTAAIFLEFCIRHAQPGTHIVAVLPDVLRSGSRYQKWRRFVEANTKLNHIEVYGRFSKWADVHVCILHATVESTNEGDRNVEWNSNSNPVGKSVGDLFNIRVGSVVDYRDPHEGETYLFAKPRELPPWKTVVNITSRRKFKGQTFSPPFVVVRRTSRQEDSFRAVATIIDGNEHVAVENHLIVLTPKSGKMSDCHQLVTNLQIDKTNIWLNQHIQCRHLTLSALRDLPWWL